MAAGSVEAHNRGGMRSRARAYLRKLTAIGIGCASAVLLAEIAYRIARLPGLGPTTNPSYVEYDPTLGWKYRPGANERHRTEEFDVDVRINAQGFRGADWNPRPAGATRILVLGDSFAFGWGVGEEQCFTSVLGGLVPHWQVLNAAVSGYGTDQQLLLLERLLPAVAPDLVVSVFCENDRLENISSRMYGQYKPYFAYRDESLELRGVPVPRPWAERASYLWRALTKSAWERALDERRVDPDGEWVLVCELYRAMVRELGGVPLLVVSEQGRLADLAREEPAIHHLDLRPVFAGAEDEVTWPLDGHWTPVAHAKVAHALEKALRPLLP
jgi:hypothetical protein